jgi:hypothetical protein
VVVQGRQGSFEMLEAGTVAETQQPVDLGQMPPQASAARALPHVDEIAMEQARTRPGQP